MYASILYYYMAKIKLTLGISLYYIFSMRVICSYCIYILTCTPVANRFRRRLRMVLTARTPNCLKTQKCSLLHCRSTSDLPRKGGGKFRGLSLRYTESCFQFPIKVLLDCLKLLAFFKYLSKANSV